MENRGIDNLNKKRTFKSASSDIFRTVVSAVENIKDGAYQLKIFFPRYVIMQEM